MGGTRILLHNPTSIIGGGEVGLLNVLSVLDDCCRPTVVLPGEGALSAELTARGIPVHILEIPASLARVSRVSGTLSRLVRAVPALPGYLLALRRTVEDLRPQLIYSNGLKSHFLCGLVARATGVPLLCHVRDVLSSVPGITFVLASLASHVIANSEATRRSLGLEADGCSVVHNVMDLKAWDRQRSAPLLPGPLAAEPHAAWVVSVGKLVPLKGFDLLVRAFQRVREEHPRARLAIVGSEDYVTQGGFGAELEALIASLGLEGCVHLLGEVRPVAPIVAAAGVVALASRSEGFGRVLLEALATERPVVATRVGGIPEVVRHGVDGLLVPCEDVEALAAALCRLLAEPDRAREMGLAGRLRVEAEFSLEHLARALVPIVSEVARES